MDIGFVLRAGAGAGAEESRLAVCECVPLLRAGSRYDVGDLASRGAVGGWA